MIRKLFAVSLVALATVPAAAFAGNSSRDVYASASKQCTAVRSKIGPVSFEGALGTFGACVSALTPLARQNANAAVASCRKLHPAGSSGKNAFAACVSAKERLALGADVAAALPCRTVVGATAFATCVTLKTQPPLTPSPVQPSPAPATAAPKGTGPATGCGGPIESGGPSHPLAASCTVAQTS